MASKTTPKDQKQRTEEKPDQKPPKPSSLSAAEKCRAVLSIWTERRKVSEVSRELNIQWAILNHWQNRALEGMMQALEPRIPLERGPALSPRLQSMLERRSRQMMPQQAQNKLEERLSRIQQARETKKETNPKGK